MAFFKTARDQIKAEALVSHLERAKTRLDPGLYETGLSLKWAVESMEKIKKCNAEYFFSRNGWIYVIELCEEIAAGVRKSGNKQLLEFCESLYTWALEHEDRLGPGGILSRVDSEFARDPMNSLRWFAEQGECNAQFKLGMILATGKSATGESVSVNIEKAVHWIEQGALQGHAEAQYSLGVIYSQGTFFPKSAIKAFEWYEKSASQGFPEAQFNLGLLFLSGEGTSKDERKAIHWFEKAAAQGIIGAQLTCGGMYERGQGVVINTKKAAELYETAAALGSPIAQFKLGVLYSNGVGVFKNEEKGVEYYWKAAASGYAAAHHKLGTMYAEGSGIPVDAVRASALFNAAFSLGHKNSLNDILAIVHLLTPSQRNDARDLSMAIVQSVKAHESQADFKKDKYTLEK